MSVPQEQMAGLADVVALERIASGGQELLTEEEAQRLQVAREIYPPRAKAEHHRANLAEHLDGNYLRKLASDVLEWFGEDRASNQEWYDRETYGMKLLGTSSNQIPGATFDGASEVVHPLLAEAIVQFQSRAIAEVWPAEGPVNAKLMGQQTPERHAQTERVKRYMNHQYMTLMPGAYEQEDQLLFRLPLRGSMFKKICFDPRVKTVTAIATDPTHLVVNYAASSLEDAMRISHVMRFAPNDLAKLMRDGVYRAVTLQQPDEGSARETTDDEKDDQESRYPSLRFDDDRNTLIEMSVDLNIPGFEDRIEGKRTGVALPYLVTVEHDSIETLSIRRNWKRIDPDKRKRVFFVHKRFSPGLGFYGFGLYHLIGGLSESATGTLRALLDSAGFANLQGGFRAKDAKIKDGDKPLSPGEWRESQATAEELKGAFFHIPYKEPSSTLFQLLGYLDEKGQRFAATTDAMVGDTRTAQMPVGTTAMLIEQGSKVFSAIHRRLHEANGKEYRLVAELNYETMNGRYPYEVEGASREVFAQDFDGRVDVIPVSDPNAVSGAQRIAQAQAVMEMMALAPDLYDRRIAHQMMHNALKISQQNLLKPEVQRLSPMHENQAMMRGEPVKAYPDQDHESHMVVHEAWLRNLPPDIQNEVLPAAMAHRAEHIAEIYRLEIERRIGQPLPSPEQLQQVDPELENQIAQATAQVVRADQGEVSPYQPPPDPELLKAQAEIEREGMKTEAAIEREQRHNESKGAEFLKESERKYNDREREHDQRLRHEREMHELRQSNTAEDAEVKSQLEALKAAVMQVLKLEQGAEQLEQKKQQRKEMAQQPKPKPAGGKS